MTDDEIDAKFLGQAGPYLGEQRAEQLLPTMWSLEQESSLDRVLNLMVPAQ